MTSGKKMAAMRFIWTKAFTAPLVSVGTVTQMDKLQFVYISDCVPVVRCKDCANGEPTKNAVGEAVIKCYEICGLCGLPRLMEPDWFCADGERRDDANA